MNKVLVFSVAILSVQRVLGDAVDPEIEDILRKANFTRYDPTLDKTFPLKELKSSLDEMATGPCRSLEPRLTMFKLYHLGYQYAEDHVKATDTFVTWCLKMDYIVSHYEKLDKMDALRIYLEKMWESLGEYILEGKKELSQLRGMGNMCSQMSVRNLQRNIGASLEALTAEFHEIRCSQMSVRNLQRNIIASMEAWTAEYDEISSLIHSVGPVRIALIPEDANLTNILPPLSGTLQKFIKLHGGSPWLDNVVHSAV